MIFPYVRITIQISEYVSILGFPGGAAVNNPPASAGDARNLGLIPRLRRSPGGGNGNPLQYFHLENSMDRGPWWAIVHGGHTELDATEYAWSQSIYIYISLDLSTYLLIFRMYKSKFQAP